jgi:hypothetical protein
MRSNASASYNATVYDKLREPPLSVLRAIGAKAHKIETIKKKNTIKELIQVFTCKAENNGRN